ncbi:hypothetical protein Q2T40_19415 [Winogradskyella maritima]|uniref:Uncharacterized protein n=1 Tax=Winogradskyella maritima TaxID=1517766 RepID=A0ABV8ADX6_9FLAO|nr:hypothetical protein [Winogradskyella maritima]
MKFSKLSILTGISIIFFLVKGIQYAIIGSYVPLLIVLIVLGSLYLSFLKSKKAHRAILRIWAVLIIIWAIARFIVWMMFEVDQNLSETHIREQFGIFQHIISIVILIIGIMIFKNKTEKPAGNNGNK